MHHVNWAGVFVLGIAIGFLAGLFGKGGSAIATPLLHVLGVPAIVAVAAPLPATIPSTAAASWAYWRERMIDHEVLGWTLAFGIPATVAGAVLSRWVSGEVLISVTDVIIAALGVRFLLWPGDPRKETTNVRHRRLLLGSVAVVVGVSSGLLANSGGFLLAPLYLAILRIPVKAAFATSLAVAAVLAIPGTVVHWMLGHIDWAIVATSVPLSYVGARVALRTNPQHLERTYGAVLIVLGGWFLTVR
jgi:uncharacterized membrane protein YfcA